MENKLKFDEKNHIYSMNGEIVPSVTQILTEVGIITPFSHSEVARIRGVYVHKAVHLHHTSGLKMESLDSVIVPFFDAYLDFLDKTKFRFVSSEEKIFNASYWYAGTYDLLGIYEGDTVLIDIKTGNVPRWACLQTAAYAASMPEPKPVRRFALGLKDNGRWALIEHKSPNDRNVFFSAASIVNWKMGRA